MKKSLLHIFRLLGCSLILISCMLTETAPVVIPTAVPTTSPVEFNTVTSAVTPTFTPSPLPTFTKTPTLTPSNPPSPTLTRDNSKDILAAVQRLLEDANNAKPQMTASTSETVYLYDYENLGTLTFLTTEQMQMKAEDWKNALILNNTFERFQQLSFANFLNLIVYMDELGNFWVADFDGILPVKIYSDPEVAAELYADGLASIALTWTPDDQHILFNLSSLGKSNLIFHLQTGVTEIWNYTCDRVAISPFTGNLAIWCPKTGHTQSYAVI